MSAGRQNAGTPALPQGKTEPCTKIALPAGTRREKLFFDAGYLLLQGAGREKSVLSWADGAYFPHQDGNKTGTFRSYTAFLGGEAVCVKNLTIENTAGSGTTAGQAVAVYADARLVYMENVCLRSRQDTLFCAPLPAREREPGGFRGPREHAPRLPSVQYYRNCRIEGDVDFIFGGADAVFEHCELRSLDKGERCNGYAAAPSGEASGLGMLFLDCAFTSDGAAEGSAYLARPWRPTGRAAFVRCRLGAHLAPALFAPWGEHADEPHAGFAVFGCTGAGAAHLEAMAPFAKRLTSAEAAALEARGRAAAALAAAPWQEKSL